MKKYRLMEVISGREIATSNDLTPLYRYAKTARSMIIGVTDFEIQQNLDGKYYYMETLDSIN